MCRTFSVVSIVEIKLRIQEMLPLAQDAINFRPVGTPARVRAGRLFRSGDLSRVTAATAQFLSSEIGVKIYLDLRSIQEQRLAPPVALVRAGVEWRPISMQGV